MWSLSDSQCRAAPHLRVIREPALVVQSLADEGCFPSDARFILEQLGSEDKRLLMVPGDHYLRSPDSLRPEVAGLIAEWIAAHGM
jgi:esterase/lipase